MIERRYRNRIFRKVKARNYRGKPGFYTFQGEVLKFHHYGIVMVEKNNDVLRVGIQKNNLVKSFDESMGITLAGANDTNKLNGPVPDSDLDLCANVS